MLFNVVMIFLIYDFQCQSEVRVLFDADDILACLMGATREHVKDLRSVLYVLNLFGHFSGLKVNDEKTFAMVKTRVGAPQPAVVAGITVKPWVKYLGVLLGNVSREQAYGPSIAKMMARVKVLAVLPLGMEERAYLFVLWVGG